MKQCKHESKRLSDRYDAYYCYECKAWLEGCCSEEGCDFCCERPPDASDETDDFLDIEENT